MTTKKDLIKQIEQLRNQLNSQNTEFLTAQDMVRNLQIEVAKTRASVLDDNGSSTKTCSEYDDIGRNVIPNGWSWIYWKFINQLTFYWLGRYSDYESEEKDEIELCKYVAIMYGIAGYSKSKKKAYYISESRDKPDTFLCYPAATFVDMNRYKSTINDNTTRWEMKFNDLEGEEIPKEDIVVCSWRFGNIGNFIWYLQDALYFLYTKQIVICNTGNLTNPLYIKSNNKNYVKSDEYKQLLSPLTNVKVITSSGEFDVPSKPQLVGNFAAQIDKDAKTVNYANELILTTKFVQEQFYTIFGIPITSSKNQSLSADANLSVTLCNNIAKEHDRRIKAFHKALGIEFNLEEPEFQPQNENADKGGMGENKNTDGDNIKKEQE